MPTVRGEIRVPDDAPGSAAAVRVRVEDVSRADASAVVVGEQVLRDVPLRGLRFEVPVERVEPGARYSVRVHVDLDGSGTLTEGDLLSTRSVPVLTADAPDTVSVPVTTIE